ncbi:MAG: bacillithiol biosynthesis cysteine-adding enzyme BshC [candidate division Zixibacteria bacterium]|nr:bacillithiol biosynthesis cysteine-adding enzyme BshC [candidate division Zixibacteria bacterium]MBU1471816.1 bacillithiol biosynthesis cysteine-adding enzyme BshC [candidate division Zixibacteria bacterium]MBU2624846.1 bacillithiol biosynthesis cysteine-adding enzyme BshC [candidate division Zixibacteria bacterium]
MRYSDLRSTSELFKDFIYDPGALSRWLGPSFHDADSFRKTAARLLATEYDRDELARILRFQNEEFGASEPTLKNIEHIADGNALCAIAGHQVVMLGGPAMILHKALTVIKLSEKLSNLLAHPVVPVFWLATDDHDFAEVDHVLLPRDDGSIEKISYSPAIPISDRAMADVILDENSTQFIDMVSEQLAETEYKKELIEDLRRFYAPGKSIYESFARFLLNHLGRCGLVLVNPSNPGLRKLSASIVAREVSEFKSARDTIRLANQSLTDAGYHLQVERDEQYLNLFHVDGMRTRVGFHDGRFFIEGVEDSVTEPALLDLISNHPERFSPNVLLRPIVQSHLLPVLAFVGGPAEVAYSTQIGSLYDQFDVVPPVVCPRMSATIVESRWAKFIDKNGVDMKQLQTISEREELLTALLKAKFPEGITASTDEGHQRVLDVLGEIRSKLGEEKSLLQALEQTRKKIDFELNSFKNRVFKAHRKANDDFSQQFRKMAAHLFPEQSLQERLCSLVYFTNKYGPGIVETIFNSLSIDDHDHQIIYL